MYVLYHNNLLNKFVCIYLAHHRQSPNAILTITPGAESSVKPVRQANIRDSGHHSDQLQRCNHTSLSQPTYTYHSGHVKFGYVGSRSLQQIDTCCIHEFIQMPTVHLKTSVVLPPLL